MTDIEKLKQVAIAATQGEWSTKYSLHYSNCHVVSNKGIGRGICLAQQDKDASFIAAANPSAVLELITRLEDLEVVNLSILTDLGNFEEKLASKDAEIERLTSKIVTEDACYWKDRYDNMFELIKKLLAAQELVIHQLRDALEKITQFASVQICSHDETYRGGNIWEICSQCGAKWADDEGGKPEFVEPKQITEGIQALTIPTSTEYLEAWYKEMVGEPVGHFYETAEHSYNQCWPSDAEAMPFHAIKPFPFKGNADDKPF